VDDGKSTLIGRLLYETMSIKQDILASVSGEEDKINLAFLTDGLRAERQQGITIDVAYKYFSTSRRAYIITDAPGHFRYTRNLVSGASTVDLIIILIDARHGITDQTRIHSQVASFLRVPSVLVAVNKMDLINYSEEHFMRIRQSFLKDAEKLHLGEARFMPVSALQGDNISLPSARMPWYTGPTFLQYLEDLPVSKRTTGSLRLSVQCAREGIYFGKIHSGILSRGDEVVIHPEGKKTQVTQLMKNREEPEKCGAGHNIAFRLESDVRTTRGDIISHPDDPPHCTMKFMAHLCWLDASKTAATDVAYILRIGSREVNGWISHVHAVMNPVTHAWSPEDKTVSVNRFARVQLRTDHPVVIDDHSLYQPTGRGILIDTETNMVVAAFVIPALLPDGSSK
jgi:sulfate adenylyltransferase subunit 1